MVQAAAVKAVNGAATIQLTIVVTTVVQAATIVQAAAVKEYTHDVDRSRGKRGRRTYKLRRNALFQLQCDLYVYSARFT